MRFVLLFLLVSLPFLVNTDADMATAIRTIVILLMALIMVGIQ